MAERAGIVEWKAASRALRGERVSGDLEVVLATSRGALLGVVDGLGHGFHAEVAARAAVEAIRRWPEEPLARMVTLCHEALAGTRGVVLGLASIRARDGRMEWLGVGNIEGAIVRRDARSERRVVSLNSRGGVLGHTLPTLRVEKLAIEAGDTILLATDGIRPGFAAGVSPVATPDRIAEEVLAGHAKESDDALVLVVRYLGGAYDDRSA